MVAKTVARRSKAPTKPPVISQLADQIFERQQTIKEHNESIKALELEVEELSGKLRDEAERLGLTAGKGATAAFLIRQKVVPQAANWDEFYKYMADNKYWHLLHRRLSSTGCEELWEQNVSIPGVEKFTKIEVQVKGIN